MTDVTTIPRTTGSARTRSVIEVTPPPANGAGRGRASNRRRTPTPLLTDAERRPVEIHPVRRLGRFAVLRLLGRIMGFAISATFRRITRRATAADTARRTRDLLEGLGGLWIKAGQVMSLRTDVLSQEMVDELSQLSHRAYGFPGDIARTVIEESLRRPIEDVFSRFEEHPFAAASISQVHRATRRRDGVVVAIKVQRPDIEVIFKRDLKLIRLLVGVAKRMPQVSHVNFDETFREIQRIMQEEVDYRFELANLYRVRKKLRKHGVLVPKVDRRLSTDRIIVMEYVDGVLMSHFADVFHADPARARRWCEENNVDLKKVGSRMMRSFYRQLFEDNLFHGDLHPGNIFLLSDSKFALIDLGTVGNVEQKLLDYYRLMSQAFSVGNYGKAMDYFLLLSESVPVFDMVEFKREAVELYRAWDAKSNLLGLTYHERSITGGIGVEFAQITQRYKITPTHQILRVTRALSTLDANLGVLLGDADPNKIMRRYFVAYRKRELRRIRKGGLGKLASSLNEARMTVGFVSEAVRQNAIKVHGIRRKIDDLARSAFGALRAVLVGVFVVVTYDYLDHHHPFVLERLHVRFEFLDTVAARLPAYHEEWALVFMFFTLYVIRLTSRVRRRYSQPAVSLPNGRTSVER